MVRRLTQEEFVAKCRELHGDAYDYSLAFYQRRISPVEIICAKHGSFMQKPEHHLKGSGCPSCANENKFKPFDEFVRVSREKQLKAYVYYPDEYDTRLGMQQTIRITCPDHGDFTQVVQNHFTGRTGCKECEYEKWEVRDNARRKTQAQFLEDCKRVHGDRYDYSNTRYLGDAKKVQIRCREHGVFWQLASNHLQGANCPTCGNISGGLNGRLKFEDFVERARQKHGNQYIYDPEMYEMSSRPTWITCPEHGVFKMMAVNHLNGEGCYHCGIEKIRQNKLQPWQEVLSKCRETHGDRYQYDADTYVNADTPMRMHCDLHGFFWQSARSHYFGGRGCPECGRVQAAQAQQIPWKERLAEFRSVHGDRYEYKEDTYGKSQEKMVIVCKNHGEFLQEPNVHKNGHGCPGCKSSKGENEIERILQERGVDYESQKSFRGLRHRLPLRVDFYLPKLNSVIEFNGVQHYESIEFFGGDEAFELNQIRDRIKEEFFKKRNVALHVIRFDESIEDRMIEILG